MNSSTVSFESKVLDAQRLAEVADLEATAELEVAKTNATILTKERGGLNAGQTTKTGKVALLDKICILTYFYLLITYFN